MKLISTTLAIMALTATSIKADEAANYKACLAKDKGHDILMAIHNFCFAPAFTVPSPHAHKGSYYHGIHVSIQQKGTCKPPVHVSGMNCMFRFHEMCAEASGGFEAKTYGPDDCQYYIIHGPGQPLGWKRDVVDGGVEGEDVVDGEAEDGDIVERKVKDEDFLKSAEKAWNDEFGLGHS